jgi:hypothetical protein
MRREIGEIGVTVELKEKKEKEAQLGRTGKGAGQNHILKIEYDMWASMKGIE